MVTSPLRVTVVTATKLETSAVRRAAPKLRVIESGIAMAHVDARELGDVVVTCGLSGGLRSDLPTGTIVVPDRVTAPSGATLVCDPVLSEMLVRAGQQRGARVERGMLVTSTELIRGAQRRVWADRGYAAADMETGLIPARRLAAVRVILDTPQHELSEVWLRPATALARPDVWPQGLWLARHGPRCARLAAEVVAAALG